MKYFKLHTFNFVAVFTYVGTVVSIVGIFVSLFLDRSGVLTICMTVIAVGFFKWHTLIKEIEEIEEDKPYKRHPMDTSGINPNVTPFNDKDIPGRY